MSVGSLKRALYPRLDERCVRSPTSPPGWLFEWYGDGHSVPRVNIEVMSAREYRSHVEPRSSKPPPCEAEESSGRLKGMLVSLEP
jgi:hypothetical protein